MPLPDTVPVPGPVRDTVTEYVFSVNLAVTLAAASTVSSHTGTVPVHAPEKPTNTELASATAVSVTRVPAANVCSQFDAHDRPVGDDVTCPEPVPANAIA